ncbi:phosphoadenylyl-sulfate reductase [Acetobacter oeni]|uniref:Adenosine 5'-phosphosulfate reductase n=1 Tax=Acetobacter oeni TaxID=304077 RepID=A0A511XKF6_9PROT|nr:phosphoadenylyl-sulfate reductase [Acetobacter oeni]MBB3881381.1 phosphoadenosine phosphosulfate reductase [Acetobacter oeni]NHO18249.1 phosphoadenylyl-sulfate reductase [Acetobacter oeni]GBR11174.1 phosphoadenosine phosphosulfate reductase [Acetobacter oeni LMG 21952]GEN63426.1 phosphoadenosine phosphosulfate reductase [Acetobacter oeni]
MTVTQHQIETIRSAGTDARAILRAARSTLPGKVAVLSSFGAESALLLAFAAEIDPAIPVLFLETGMHFPETLQYRRDLAADLGLTNVRDIPPAPKALEQRDPSSQLWAFDPDACCQLRKVEPLNLATLPFSALITGRKRSQAATRHRMEVVEPDGEDRIKINPLADWTAEDIDAEMTRRNLRRNPLSLKGYPSIGCEPCTRPAGENDDPRAGRWAGQNKVECGIHKPA